MNICGQIHSPHPYSIHIHCNIHEHPCYLVVAQPSESGKQLGATESALGAFVPSARWGRVIHVCVQQFENLMSI